MSVVSALEEFGLYIHDCAMAPYSFILDTTLLAIRYTSIYASYLHYYVFISYIYTGNIIFNNSFFGNYLSQLCSPQVVAFKIDVDSITYDVFLNFLAMDTNYIVNIFNSYFTNNKPSDFVMLPYFGNLMFEEGYSDMFEGTFLSNFDDYISKFEIIFDHPVVNFVFNIFYNIIFSFIFFFFYIFFIIELIFSEYRIKVASKKNIDIEHLSNQITVESEKEIASFDDMIPFFLALFLTIGWFFWANSIFSISSHYNPLLFSQLILPGLAFMTFVAPFLILYDFGLFFVIYLRGSGTTSLLAAEILYDMITLFSFFIRITIQMARLILMLTALGSFQEYIDGSEWYPFAFLLNDTLLNFLLNPFYFNYTILDFFLKIILVVVYILYEVFHTFFVTTIQTIAFFSMVFWLFFYLFTFFVSERAEKLFEKKKEFYRNNYNKF